MKKFLGWLILGLVLVVVLLVTVPGSRAAEKSKAKSQQTLQKKAMKVQAPKKAVKPIKKAKPQKMAKKKAAVPARLRKTTFAVPTAAVAASPDVLKPVEPCWRDPYCPGTLVVSGPDDGIPHVRKIGNELRWNEAEKLVKEGKGRVRIITRRDKRWERNQAEYLRQYAK